MHKIWEPRLISVQKTIRMFFPVFLLLFGLLSGTIIGNHLINGFLLNNKNWILLLYSPSFYYFNTANMLNSDDELKRLAGYYSMRESKKIDIPFLMERFKDEPSLFVKRTLIWVIGYSREKRIALKNLSAIYDDSPLQIKNEILRSAIRIDRDKLLEEFVKQHKVDTSILKQLRFNTAVEDFMLKRVTFPALR